MIQLSSIVADTDGFLFNSPNGYDTFVLKVTGFTANGQPVSVPGLNSDYSLYFEGTVAVSGNPRSMVPAPSRCCSIRPTMTVRQVPRSTRQHSRVELAFPTLLAQRMTLRWLQGNLSVGRSALKATASPD